ncbi:class I SAM-dependent methyltransferase [uncultured Sphingomonas sp.]|uniref:class I SAM-dependent methyltransferase n=1 Tax=uncultured Sphingomonas sp. TaxID=158754 RepID=UPI00374896B9
MSSITSENLEQYRDSQKLAARARLHNNYTIAEMDWFPWVAKQLPLEDGDSILDVGCGPGWFWESAASKLPDGLNLTLSDLSPGMVQEAVDRCRSLPFASVAGRQADATDLPFEDESFDAIIAMHMLYHLSDPSKGLAEMRRVLKPGGFLAVTTNGAGNRRELYALTTVFGSEPFDPAGAVFGYAEAERSMKAAFGNVSMAEHPAILRVTEPEDVFLALTSYPPGDRAEKAQLTAFRDAIAEAFRAGNGVLEVVKESGFFVSRKAA